MCSESISPSQTSSSSSPVKQMQSMAVLDKDAAHKSPSMQKTLKKSFPIREKVTAQMPHMLKKTSSPLTAFDSPKVVQAVRYVVQDELTKQQGREASGQRSAVQRSVQTVNQNASVLSSRLSVSSQDCRGMSTSTAPG